jgi:hypothetical protein
MTFLGCGAATISVDFADHLRAGHPADALRSR